MLRPIFCLKDDPPMLVSDFIETTSASWRTDKLEEFFLPMDYECIKAIPLSTRRLDDCWAWHYEKTGVMSVRRFVASFPVWTLADKEITEHLCMNEDPNPKQWLFAMMESLSRDDFARVAVTLWAIWFARRKIIHEEEFQSPLSMHMFIESYLRDLAISSKAGKKKVSTSTISQAPKWIPPSLGYAKLNVDAAMSKTSRGGAVGVICRSDNGDFMGASTLTVSGINDPATMEAIACREAMALAKDLQLHRVTVASDCLSVINAINSEGFKGSYIMILDEQQGRPVGRMPPPPFVGHPDLPDLGTVDGMFSPPPSQSDPIITTPRASAPPPLILVRLDLAQGSRNAIDIEMHITNPAKATGKEKMEQKVEEAAKKSKARTCEGEVKGQWWPCAAKRKSRRSWRRKASLNPQLGEWFRVRHAPCPQPGNGC
ncbi:hypothetical protein QYE76_068203 [Lolium multiflorum]|uniref:RNase H type-1 domain-containing protein n=1 Tax=Lolium multiflorum TaxID=4521 RepID=A0AAD8SFT8_LOLMU|nr:hypothetical protein QYE76_068203 [Lolium multiflorum]